MTTQALPKYTAAQYAEAGAKWDSLSPRAKRDYWVAIGFGGTSTFRYYEHLTWGAIFAWGQKHRASLDALTGFLLSPTAPPVYKKGQEARERKKQREAAAGEAEEREAAAAKERERWAGKPLEAIPQTSAERDVTAKDRLQSVLREIQRLTARLYSQRNVSVRLLQGEYAAHSTQGEARLAGPSREIVVAHQINITSPGVYDKAEQATIRALGLHEIAHILYTTPTRALSAGIEHMCYNILEDARIEWLLVNAYPGTRKHLIRLMSVIPGVKQPLLLWGRRYYLPYQVDPPKPPRVADIIDEYLAELSAERRFELAKEMAKILSAVQEVPPEHPVFKNEDSESQSGGTAGEKDAKTKAQEEKAAEAAKKARAEDTKKREERKKQEAGKRPAQAEKAAPELARRITEEVQRAGQVMERLSKPVEETA